MADRGKVASHQDAPASALSFGLSGEQVAERPLSWGFYRVQVNPMGRGLVGVSSDHVLHCYDEQLRNLVALPLDQTPELRAAKSRLGITDREVHTHIRSAALRPDGGAYLFSVVRRGIRLGYAGSASLGGAHAAARGLGARGHDDLAGRHQCRRGRRTGRSLALSYPFGTEDVRRQYRELAKRWHPDKNPGNEVQAAQEFRKVVAATELLSAFDMTDFAAPEERAIYRKDLGGTQEVSLGDTGLTLTIGMSLGGDEPLCGRLDLRQFVQCEWWRICRWLFGEDRRDEWKRPASPTVRYRLGPSPNCGHGRLPVLPDRHAAICHPGHRRFAGW